MNEAAVKAPNGWFALSLSLSLSLLLKSRPDQKNIYITSAETLTPSCLQLRGEKRAGGGRHADASPAPASP